MPSIALQVKDLSFSYKDRVEKTLDGLNFEINSGQFVAVTGQNGSGKTTLLKIVLGILKNQSGQIKLLDQDIKKFDKWKKIGFVPQNTGLGLAGFPATVKELIFTQNQKIDKDSSFVKKLIDQTLDLNHILDKRLDEISGGQRQKAFLAASLVNQPEILFLDEPTSSVDIQNRDNFYELLNKLKNENLTIVIITHDLEEIQNYVDRVLCIHKSSLFEDKKGLEHVHR
jgi:zinc transport system ATP-binding protein